jgi:predicted metal-binding protein
MKPYDFKFTTGSLFICSKCGKSFDQPESDRADRLKTDLRAHLTDLEAQKKVRVMVGSCLGVCIAGEQSFAYYPHQGKSEIFTTDSDYEKSRTEILEFIKTKI